MTERGYTRIDQHWIDISHVRLLYPDGKELCRLPMKYLEKSNSSDWQLVLDIAQALLTETIVLADSDGSSNLSTHQPVAGTYFIRNALNPKGPLTPKIGPEGNRRYVPLDDQPQSSKSRSTRSTPRQSNFRIALIARDSVCLVTGSPWYACIASHIVPFSRLDVYQQIYNPGLTESNLFTPSMGVLLADQWSRMFDRFMWSIYVRDGKYFIHGPALSELYQEYHGKEMKIAVGHAWPSSEMPDPIFCNWHWEQTMQAHARGFAVWPPMEDVSQRQPGQEGTNYPNFR